MDSTPTSSSASTGQLALGFDHLPSNGPGPQRKERHRRATSQTPVTARSRDEAFEVIKRRKVKLYVLILSVVAEHGPEPNQCLTAREILRVLKALGYLPPTAERNQTSPRCFELRESGCLENPDFLKKVAGDATASVWRITPRGRLLLEHLRSQGDRG